MTWSARPCARCLRTRALAQPAGALKPREAARYIGRSRSRLYELLEHDPLIQAASFKQGKSRIFLVSGLDEWLSAQQTAEQEPKDKVAAQRREQMEDVS